MVQTLWLLYNELLLLNRLATADQKHKLSDRSSTSEGVQKTLDIVFLNKQKLLHHLYSWV